MFTLTKINLLWDKVKALEKNASASKLPDVSGSDNGDVLTVVEGAWEKAAIPSQLPSVTGADNGNVLGVVEGAWAKMAAPSGGLDYSTSEQDTGLKWIDNRPIYRKTYTGTAGTTSTVLEEASGILPINCNGFIVDSQGLGVSIGGIANSSTWTMAVHVNAEGQLCLMTGTATNGGNYYVTVDYVKPAQSRRTKK